MTGSSTGRSDKTVFDRLKTKIYNAPLMREIRNSIVKGAKQVEYARAAGSLTSFVISSLVEKEKQKILLVSPETRTAERTRDDLRTLLGDERIFFMPPRAAIPYDPLHQNPRFDERAGVFEKLITGDFDVIITLPATLVEKTEDISRQKKRMISFKVGDSIDRDALILVLSEAGMRREVRAEGPGDLAVRGAVIDIYPPSAEIPVRLELWGDEIIELRNYDPVTQRSKDHLDEISFYAGEQADINRTECLLDILDENITVFVDDPDALESGLLRVWEEIDYQYIRHRDLEKDIYTHTPDELYIRPGTIHANLAERQRIIHRGAASPTSGAINFDSRTHETYLGDLDRFANNLKQNKLANLDNIILCDRESQVARLEDLLDDRGVSPGDVQITVGSLHEGFTWMDAGVALMTDHQIFGRHKRTAPFRHRQHRVDPTAFEQLKMGDFVVHMDFGIGKYLGLKKINVKNMERECLQVEYRDGVKVYVRLNQFSRLQRFQGTDGVSPRLSKIGGSDWDSTRAKTKKAVEEMAKDIIQLYARRQVEGGRAFTADTPWQREMEAAFEFEDTPDQSVASREIKDDMEKPVAMDRLLCGDVGFGKTEVAVRAAFKAIQDSSQIAILVPTTILAQQHFVTISERLRKYPIRIEVLSRFRSKKEQKEVVEGLASGVVDLVIGTHRLLSKDIQFKNLGLMVIDEEHRFGVKHKEKLKRFRATVDVLTLSATPIPRTLNFALSGVKDMSMIATAPHDRHPIQTEIVPFDNHVIREAILREVARGGQIYFLHNRVKSILAMKGMLERLVPGIKIAVAHGQMKERDLEKVMDDFLHERFQVLVCTMIIESGLDLPNVNTLIINRADRLGLAQLYQVRGRIGRSFRQAYAYLLTPPRMLLNPDARKRLETIAENTRLGSGFQIAMRDLEIRGAGNLLGAQQSGFINQVGFELYTEMLSEAVKNMGEKEGAELPEVKKTFDPRNVKVDIAVNAMLPTMYISDAAERVEFYRRLSRAQTQAEVLELRGELRDRFGPLPDDASHLLDIVETQTLSARSGVTRVDLHDDVAFFEFEADWGGDNTHEYIGELIRLTEDMPIELKGTGSLGLRLALERSDDWNEHWKQIKLLLERLPEME
ncbi:MAG: transcription-repair coupling factor [Candidatus Electryonea clarkiae]|nr:transcription-repair coupling factor [Candidatus Electryonea clarkiae]MDP8288579.1 transcription-repair coupling factor [Candidatus Electryonea clarkiae]